MDDENNSPPLEKDYGVLPPSVKDQCNVRRFRISIEEQKLQDLKTLWRLSPVMKNTYENQDERKNEGYNFGVQRSWLLSTKGYMDTEFDWRKQETHLNSFPQYQADIVDDDGKTYTVHFAALFSQRRDAVPMARLTGWPCSFAESLPLLEILRGKYQPKELPYHFILPSQPGWPFSSAPPTDRDWTYADSARILHKLMTVALGLKSYALSGGDIGAGIARIMASQFREVQVLHTNYVQMPQPDEGPDVEMLQAYEREGVYRGQTFMATGTAYGRMQGTRPSTLAAVLSSSPLALLAWIGEKYLEWSDPAIVVPVDHILTTVCLYWFTGACATTFYPYREDYLVGVALGNEKAAKKGYLHGQKDLRVDKPFGYSDFPQEPVPCPKPWAEKSGRLVWYRRHQQGGHFPDLERSEALLEDLEDFLSKVWETDVCVDSWCCRDSASPIV